MSNVDMLINKFNSKDFKETNNNKTVLFLLQGKSSSKSFNAYILMLYNQFLIDSKNKNAKNISYFQMEIGANKQHSLSKAHHLIDDKSIIFDYSKNSDKLSKNINDVLDAFSQSNSDYLLVDTPNGFYDTKDESFMDLNDIFNNIIDLGFDLKFIVPYVTPETHNDTKILLENLHSRFGSKRINIAVSLINNEMSYDDLLKIIKTGKSELIENDAIELNYDEVNIYCLDNIKVEMKIIFSEFSHHVNPFNLLPIDFDIENRNHLAENRQNIIDLLIECNLEKNASNKFTIAAKVKKIQESLMKIRDNASFIFDILFN